MELFTTSEVLSLLQLASAKRMSSPKINSLYEYLKTHSENHIDEASLTRIRELIDGTAQKNRYISAEVKEWVEGVSGTFHVKDLLSSLQITNRVDQKNVAVVLGRLAKEGMIEKDGRKYGAWRTIQRNYEVMDFINAPTDEYPIDFPLDIQHYVKIFPGNIVVVAGASNTGKTSFLLDLIRLNQDTHKIRYLNSEMGETELRNRIELFHEVAPIEAWNFTAIERSSDWWDVIDPDGLNVIDYLEIYDDFYKIGQWINNIHQKLNQGVCVIAIQKQSDTKQRKQDFGRGGEFSLEKPRLYLAMDRGEMRIIKAKTFRDYNPNGWRRRFKLIRGWKFHPEGQWFSDKEEEGGFI